MSGPEDYIDDIEARAERALASVEKAAGDLTPLPVFRVVDLSQLDQAPTELTDYIIDPYLPRGLVALFSGHGGSGKTNLALAWAAHVAAGWNWNGCSVAPGRVLIASLEDPGERVRAVLRRIVEAYDLPWRPVADNIVILDGTAGDAALAAEFRDPHQGAVLVETNAFCELAMQADGFDLIVIDNASDAYDGNENERRSVRKFLRGMLGKIAREKGCAVLLLAHIDKFAARNGGKCNTFSGSTAWHNSARSRMALVESEIGTPELVHEKLNVGKKADPVSLEWSARGVLLPTKRRAPDADDDQPDTLASDAAAILTAITAAHASGSSVSTANTGSTTTVHVLNAFELPEELGSKRNRRRFWNALRLLERSGQIEKESYEGTNRATRDRWIPARMHA